MGLRYLPFSATEWWRQPWGLAVSRVLCQPQYLAECPGGWPGALRRADREAVQGVVSGEPWVASRLRPPDQFLSPCRP